PRTGGRVARSIERSHPPTAFLVANKSERVEAIVVASYGDFWVGNPGSARQEGGLHQIRDRTGHRVPYQCGSTRVVVERRPVYWRHQNGRSPWRGFWLRGLDNLIRLLGFDDSLQSKLLNAG